MKLFPLKLVVIAALAMALFAGPAHAEMILYSNDAFSGSSTLNLHGTTPSTTIGTNTWTAWDGATGAWKADGSIASNSFTHGAFLPFVPESGLIYTLSATLDQPAGGSGGGRWAAIGFTDSHPVDGPNTLTFFGSPNNASPWMLYRPEGGISTFTGPQIDGAEAHAAQSGEQTLTIVLDTTDTAWTAEWFVSGAGADPVRTHTFGVNPTITHVGLGRSNGVGANFHSFTLTYIPEPGTGLLALVAVAGLLLVRRRK